MKRTVKKDDAPKFLDTLLSDAKIYRVIHDPSSREWRIEERSIREALEALLLFRVQQPMPFVLSVLRGYVAGNLGVKLATRALTAVERFHFVFTSVTSQRSSGGISAMYALHARDLQMKTDNNSRARAIDELVAKLRDRRPSFEEFLPYFRELRASEIHSKQKKLVQYILARMSHDMKSGQPLDKEKMTIEHLANQTQPPSGLLPMEVAEIGNLFWVPDALQGKLGNRPPDEKFKIIQNEGLWVNDISKKHMRTWDAGAIRSRTDALAKLAYDKVWEL